jgi:hypothetical protein
MAHFIGRIPEQSLDLWYRWLTILAIGLPILGAFFGGLCGYAAFMVSARTSYLQAVALKHAEDTAAEARELAKSRRMLPEESSRMLVVARQLCSQLKRVPVTAANGNQEAQAYAIDFVEMFKNAGCASDLQLPIPGITADVQGVRIGVRSLTNIPAEVGLLDKIFLAGGIRYQINPLKSDFFPGEPFVLIIGAKPTTTPAPH